MAVKKPRSYYSNALEEAERVELRNAAVIEGVDQEIALVRFQIKHLTKISKARDTEEINRCINALCRMLITRYTLEGKGKKDLKKALANVLRDIALPLGLKVAESFITKQISP